ncbi:hypothetical protein G5V59_00535 [Nocardioides sp. W3-2-3]|nr:hypothetical protein [Nocardioides convexus]
MHLPPPSTLARAVPAGLLALALGAVSTVAAGADPGVSPRHYTGALAPGGSVTITKTVQTPPIPPEPGHRLPGGHHHQHGRQHRQRAGQRDRHRQPDPCGPALGPVRRRRLQGHRRPRRLLRAAPASHGRPHRGDQRDRRLDPALRRRQRRPRGLAGRARPGPRRGGLPRRRQPDRGDVRRLDQPRPLRRGVARLGHRGSAGGRDPGHRDLRPRCRRLPVGRAELDRAGVVRDLADGRHAHQRRPRGGLGRDPQPACRTCRPRSRTASPATRA